MNQSPGLGLEAKVITACHNFNKQTTTNKQVIVVKYQISNAYVDPWDIQSHFAFTSAQTSKVTVAKVG